MPTNETICAIATAGGGALGVIRISGPDALSIADKLFTPTAPGTAPLARRDGYTLVYGSIAAPGGEPIDYVVASVYRSPHSYTGEDAVELSCHGSPYVMRTIVQLLIDAGCRPARPGEYTQRAFLNGKMDLSQAEAVADLIASSTAAAHRMAVGQMRGAFSQRLAELRQRLLRLTALMELELDFSDHEELEFANRDELRAATSAAEAEISALADTFAAGNAIKQGIPVAIVGDANAGKSTLLNALVGDDRAIVSDIGGTTRDAIEDTAVVEGTQFRFIDTAGLRETTDTIETIGIELALKKAAQADIVMWTLDAADAPGQYQRLAPRLLPIVKGKTLLLLINKTDLFPDAPPPICPQATTLRIAAKTGLGLDALRQTLARLAPQAPEGGIVVSNARHYAALRQAADALRQAWQGLATALPTDLVAEHLRHCLRQLGEITGGEITSEETLSAIFERFCIGK